MFTARKHPRIHVRGKCIQVAGGRGCELVGFFAAHRYYLSTYEMSAGVRTNAGPPQTGWIDRTGANQRPGIIRYEVDQAFNYGNLPADDMRRKFEETNSGPDEDLYDNYARGQLTNWGPDPLLFEHEQARGGITRRSGIVESRTTGHRGTADYARPELFLGFAGPEERDPRGINTDPDMRKLKQQQDARMRFQRFTPDGSDHVTGGGRSQGELMGDIQTQFRINRDRLKVFSRQIDGRREGMRRTYTHASDARKQVTVQAYGDLIEDYALTPQRRANIICDRMVRDSKAYREGTADADFAIAKYGQTCRRQKRKDTYSRVLGAQDADDTRWVDGDPTMTFHAIALLATNLMKARHQHHCAVRDSDADLAGSRQTAAYKTAALTRDLCAIMKAQRHSTALFDGDRTQTRQTLRPVQREHNARMTMRDGLTPAHHALNASLAYKALARDGDFSAIRRSAVVDPAAAIGHSGANALDTPTQGKTARRDTVSGARLDRAYDSDPADAKNTFNYKAAALVQKARVGDHADTHRFGADADATQTRAVPHTDIRHARPDETDTNIEFSDNASGERMTGGVGTKYVRRYMDREHGGVSAQGAFRDGS